MIFNMVGGGGGSLKNTDAVLIVSVPTGSTVTATKGGVTITPTIWVQNADNTLDTAIFSIKASTFDSNPWTVTATLGADSASSTLVINNNKQYDIALRYSTPLFNNGDQCTAITGGWTSSGYSYSGHGNKNGGTVGQTLSVSSVSGSSANNYGILGTANGIILGNIDAIDVSATIENYRGESRYCVILTTTKSITDSNHVADIAFTSSGTKTIDVSNLSKSTQYYISVVSYVTSAPGTYSSTFNVSSIIGQG